MIHSFAARRLTLLYFGLVGGLSGFAGIRSAVDADASVPVESADEGGEFAAVFDVLQARCTRCHGAKRAKAGLRLDQREAAMAGSFFGETPVILAGNSADSILFQRLVTEDEDERMPAGDDALSSEEIELFRNWIDGGAVWPESGEGEDSEKSSVQRHWAYVAPLRPEVGQDGLHGMDALAQAQLHEKGLKSNPQAEPERLLRRMCLDLTGLPPSLAELDFGLQEWTEFGADEAMARATERWLAQDAYGEHQARFWLDLARYADTNGYEKDSRRTMWRYRDWVIDAYNRDMGFDEFTVAQLAGDLLPEPGVEDLIATGFHRNTMLNLEGGVDPEEYRVSAVVDRVNTTAEVWLGSTLACAQCHNHKYDPISQKDYYSFYAFFNNSVENGASEQPRVPAPTSKQLAAEPQVKAAIAEVEAQMEGWTPLHASEYRGLLSSVRDAERRAVVLRPARANAVGETRLAVLDDDSVLAISSDALTETYQLEFDVQGACRVQELRLDVLRDATLPGGGPGRADHSNFVLSEVDLEVVVDSGLGNAEDTQWRGVDWLGARADHEQSGYAAAKAIDGDLESGWAIGGAVDSGHELRLGLAEPLELAAGSRVRLSLHQNYHSSPHLIGRLRVALLTVPEVDSEEGSGGVGELVAPALRETLLASDLDPATEPPAELGLHAWLMEHSGEFEPFRRKLAALEAKLNYPTALIMRELPEPRMSHIHIRGSFLNPGKPVQPAIPAALGKLELSSNRKEKEGEQLNRLDLARWIADRNNPLTARVYVNRVWARIFGQGLVLTAGDFGSQAEPVSNQQLLDWLAVEFMESGWSTKALYRTILGSQTYRQSSQVLDESVLEIDPNNRWLARGPRFRVEGESLRDLALRASGLLHEEVGGPSVFPPQPAGVWNATYNADKWVDAKDEDRYRRGLYTFWRRTSPYPTFMLFDAPSRELCTSTRSRTNTPLQALVLLNDPAFLEFARGLAQRMLNEAGETSAGFSDLISHGFRICTGRKPEAREVAVLKQFYASERAIFIAHPEQALELLKQTNWELPEDVSDEELAEYAAWVLVANALLNLDETVTKS